MSWYQKGKTSLNFTEAGDSEWQWYQLSHIICKSAPRSRQITMLAPHCSSFLQAGCPSCCPANSVEALCVINRKIFCKSGPLALSDYGHCVRCVLMLMQSVCSVNCYCLTVLPCDSIWSATRLSHRRASRLCGRAGRERRPGVSVDRQDSLDEGVQRGATDAVLQAIR